MVAPPFPNYKDGDDNDDGDTAVGSCENTDSARQKKRESGIEQFSAKEIFFQILLKQFYCHCVYADRKKNSTPKYKVYRWMGKNFSIVSDKHVLGDFGLIGDHCHCDLQSSGHCGHYRFVPAGKSTPADRIPPALACVSAQWMELQIKSALSPFDQHYTPSS